MKKIIKALGILFITISLIIFFYNQDINRAKIKTYERQIGIFIIDTNNTTWGNYDKKKYANLSIVFNEDSTFYLNESVPFMFDSCGRWEAGGGDIDSWSFLYFKNMKYDNLTGEQFSQITFSKDSTFYINSCTPKRGKDFVQEIHFRPTLVPSGVSSTTKR